MYGYYCYKQKMIYYKNYFNLDFTGFCDVAIVQE